MIASPFFVASAKHFVMSKTRPQQYQMYHLLPAKFPDKCCFCAIMSKLAAAFLSLQTVSKFSP